MPFCEVTQDLNRYEEKVEAARVQQEKTDSILDELREQKLEDDFDIEEQSVIAALLSEDVQEALHCLYTTGLGDAEKVIALVKCFQDSMTKEFDHFELAAMVK